MNGLYVAASGAASRLTTLKITAENLSNVNTPGFRRVLTYVQALGGRGSPYEYAVSGGPASIDMRQGPLRRTGNPMDVALSGPGFMAVRTPRGIAYTRDGELSVSPQGVLMAAGRALESTTGGEIRLGPGKVEFSANGVVSVDGNGVGQIALGNPSGIRMEPMGLGLYRPVGPMQLPTDSPQTSFHQGFLENSTGNVVGAMLSMVSALRGYQAAMKAVTSINKNEKRAIQTFTMA